MHRIRLHGPWDFHFTPESDSALRPSVVESGQVTMPLSWRGLLGNRAGTAKFIRGFNTPTGLEDDDNVCLCLPGNLGTIDLKFNDTAVELILAAGEDALRSANVRSLLRETRQNRFEITLTFDPALDWTKPGGLWTTVSLLIG